MSNTNKTVGRPVGTGSVSIKAQELVDKFGGEVEVPVRWKWLQDQTEKQKAAENSTDATAFATVESQPTKVSDSVAPVASLSAPASQTSNDAPQKSLVP